MTSYLTPLDETVTYQGLWWTVSDWR